MRTQVNGGEETLNWLLSDHLGSTSMTTDASGNVVSEVRYSAFGEMRYQNGTTPTDYLYTGQRQEAELGLYYYVARWYDPAIGRFIQADSIIPNAGKAKAFDRYAYTLNNPVQYSDPSGHVPIYLDGNQLINTELGVSNHYSNTQTCYGIECQQRPKPFEPWKDHDKWPDDEYLFGKTPENYFKSSEDIFLEGFQSPLGYPYNYGGYGARNTLGGSGYHPGIDSRTVYGSEETIIVNELGRSVYNVYDGVVTNTGDYGSGFGNYVVVEHDVYGTKYYSVYAHLSSVTVNVGEELSAGTKVGELGQSGTHDPHLHFEVRKENNISINNPNPFRNHIYWPGSYAECTRYFVDLGQLPYVRNEGFGQ